MNYTEVYIFVQSLREPVTTGTRDDEILWKACCEAGQESDEARPINYYRSLR